MQNPLDSSATWAWFIVNPIDTSQLNNSNRKTWDWSIRYGIDQLNSPIDQSLVLMVTMKQIARQWKMIRKMCGVMAKIIYFWLAYSSYHLLRGCPCYLQTPFRTSHHCSRHGRWESEQKWSLSWTDNKLNCCRLPKHVDRFLDWWKLTQKDFDRMPLGRSEGASAPG
jgi:hypothetical protein